MVEISLIKSRYLNKLIILFIGVLFVLGNTQCDILSEDIEKEPESDFAVKDTTNIVKFRISDTQNNSITITRENKARKWMIEGTEYGAQPNNVKLIMDAFYRIRVKQDIPEKGIENQLKMLSVQHKKVEIFKKGAKKPVKTWYVGGTTKDHMGTYMLLQNGKKKSSVPFIVHKPGFYGTLDVRFFTGLVNWRASDVYNYRNPLHIQSIKVTFNEDPTQSYKVNRNKDQSVSLFNASGQKVMNFDSIQVKHYFTHYNKVYFNKVVQEKNEYVDSVFSNIPTYSIELTDLKGKTTLSELWKIKYATSITTSIGNVLEYNPDYGFLRLNKGKELLRIQYQNWDLLFKPLSFFTR